MPGQKLISLICCLCWVNSEQFLYSLVKMDHFYTGANEIANLEHHTVRFVGWVAIMRNGWQFANKSQMGLIQAIITLSTRKHKHYDSI